MTLAFSGIANTLGTVAGHPLDTIRVSLIVDNNVCYRFACNSNQELLCGKQYNQHGGMKV